MPEARSVDRKLLDILCCPASRKPLRHATADEIKHVNRAIGEGRMQTTDGCQLTTPLVDALATEDGVTLYRLEDGIPVLLADQAIAGDEQADPRDSA